MDDERSEARSTAAEAGVDADVAYARAGVDADILTTGGQRRINLRGQELNSNGVTGLVLLSSLATNVLTSFTRTNHTKIGGVGRREEGR
jgi:hypothetical protein